MSAFVDRMKTMGERLPGGGHHQDDAGGPPSGHAQRGKAISVSVLLMALVVGVVGTGVLLARDHSVGGLLGSHPASASAAADPLIPTQLVALPSRKIANGTQPLIVTLSAPPAPSSPQPTLRPALAGTWAAVGNSEVFTPASTLMPCSTYTLTVWADTTSTGHSRLGKRHTIGLNVTCPPVIALQQALARLGYMGATFHARYVAHIPSARETRGEAATHAFHPPRGVLVPDPSDAPAVETGHLDETTRGCADRLSVRPRAGTDRRTELRHLGVAVRGGDRLPPQPQAPTPG